MFSEIRKDYFQDIYTIIAPRRNDRPHSAQEAHGAPKRIANICAFCPEHEEHPEGIYCKTKDQKGACPKNREDPWDIKVVNNKFPAVTLDNKHAYGVQEVIIETRSHKLNLEDLESEHIEELLEVYSARTTEITKNPKIGYVMIFKNQGGASGASLEHAHSQVFATAFIPPHLIDKAQRTQKYTLEHGTCVFCDIILEEDNSPRFIYKDAYTIAFCPYASLYNYEVWILPLRHFDNITLLTKEERVSWARILKQIIGSIRDIGLDYNYYFHQVVNDENQHFYMKITPRGSLWAGVEIGSGVIINPVAPEAAAGYFRQHLKV